MGPPSWEFVDRSPRSTYECDAEESISTAVLAAVGAASEEPLLELPKLGAAVDVDALEALFSDRTTNGYLTFRYAGCGVIVDAAGTVEVYR